MIRAMEHEFDAEPAAPPGGGGGRDRTWYFSLFAYGNHPGYPKGTEVFNSYGRRSNRHLMMNYGFSMAYNEHDVLRFTAPIPPPPPPPCEGETNGTVTSTDQRNGHTEEVVQKRRHMGRLRLYGPFSVSLRADEFNQKWMGICRLAAMSVDELRAYVDARVASAPPEEPLLYVPSARLPSCPISQANEGKALESMQVFLDDKLREYPTSVTQDRMLLQCACLQDWFRSAVSYRLSLKMILVRHKAFVVRLRQSLNVAQLEHPVLVALYEQHVLNFVDLLVDTTSEDDGRQPTL